MSLADLHAASLSWKPQAEWDVGGGLFARRLPPCGWTMRLNHAAERLGGSPRLCSAPKVPALAKAFAVSVCPQAAAMRLG